MEKLNNRLQGLAASLEKSGKGVARLALGSVGIETERADAYSDLDFFAFVEAGTKADFLSDTTWLNADSTVEWIFRNSADGFKLLWQDGIFGEMAVFEMAELPNISFAPGRLIWAKAGIDREVFARPSQAGRRNMQPNVAYNEQELLTNLYVGLGRYFRGEKFSGWRFVQTRALNLALAILESEAENLGSYDVYNLDRRIEQRVPAAIALIHNVVGNIDHTPHAAAALLEWLQQRGYPQDALVKEVAQLLQQS